MQLNNYLTMIMLEFWTVGSKPSRRNFEKSRLEDLEICGILDFWDGIHKTTLPLQPVGGKSRRHRHQAESFSAITHWLPDFFFRFWREST